MAVSSVVAWRVGQGWDTHRIENGRPMILGGVTIPSDFGLAGHSDADVLFHALTDAILGAVALGDIGMHFPDTDPQWKNAESIRFLQESVRLAASKGYQVVNVDTTIVLERPKLMTFRQAIKDNLARVLDLPSDCVNVKFKTAERVGPVGEGRSCEAQAVVLLGIIS